MAPNIITRKQARAQGLTRYFTGKPCKHGHIAGRTASTGFCLECARLIHHSKYHADPEKYRLISKEYVARNREDILKRRRNEYATNSEKHIVRSRNYRKTLSPERLLEIKENKKYYYIKNHKRYLEQSRQYRIENSEKVRNREQKYNKSDRGKLTKRVWAIAYKERRKEAERRRRKENPESFRRNYRKWASKDESKAVITANAHKRRARLLSAPGNHKPIDLMEILKSQGNRCAYCRADLRRTEKHVDHIMPLALGGSNGRENLQFLCRPCNLSKSARDPVDHARSLGLLV